MATITVPDVPAAIRAHLLADAGVAAQVGTRVYSQELPRDMADDMPVKAVVARSSSGGFGPGRLSLPVQSLRIDTTCYGASTVDAYAVHAAVHKALKYLSRRTIGAVLLHWATVDIAALHGRDPDVPEWAFVFASWNVLAAEVAVT